MTDTQWTYLSFTLPVDRAQALLLVGQHYGQPDRVADEDWRAAEAIIEQLPDEYANFMAVADDDGLREATVVLIDGKDGSVEVEGQFGGGIGSLTQVAELLREQGVAYEMRDEGGLEWDAMIERWKPGDEQPFCAACTHGGEVVVDERAFDEIVRATTTRDDLIAGLNEAYGRKVEVAV